MQNSVFFNLERFFSFHFQDTDISAECSTPFCSPHHVPHPPWLMECSSYWVCYFLMIRSAETEVHIVIHSATVSFQGHHIQRHIIILCCSSVMSTLNTLKNFHFRLRKYQDLEYHTEKNGTIVSTRTAILKRRQANAISPTIYAGFQPGSNWWTGVQGSSGSGTQTEPRNLAELSWKKLEFEMLKLLRFLGQRIWEKGTVQRRSYRNLHRGLLEY